MELMGILGASGPVASAPSWRGGLFMFRSYTVLGLVAGLVALFIACSSDEDDDNSNGSRTGTPTGTSGSAGPGTATGTGSVPVQATVSPTGDVLTLADGTQVVTMTDAAGNRVAVLPDGQVVTVLDDNTVVTGAPAETVPDDWDVYVVTDACTQVSVGAVGSPAYLQFVIDKSTSMNRDPESARPQTKWEATRDALISSFPEMDPSLSVGALFYPNTDDSNSECLPGCARDVGALSVPIAPLDAAQVQALQEGAASVPNPTNIPGTPTHDAWRVGLARLRTALASAPPLTRGYLVLMTDGMPTLTFDCGPSYGCTQSGGSPGGVDSSQWQQILDDVANTTATTGIDTFVVGVPGSEENGDVPEINGRKDYVPRDMLSMLAIAGHTAAEGCSPTGPNYCHIDMTVTDDFVSSLRNVIGTIAQSIVSCEYQVPEVNITNVFVNPEDVAVNYYVGGAETPLILTRSMDGCATGAWVYNDDMTVITLCDAACTNVRNDPAARIEVDFGCLVPL